MIIHYVPKVYLKQWSDDGLNVWAYRLWFPTRMFLNGITVLWIKLRSYEICILKLKMKKKLTKFEKWLEFEFENPVQESIRKVLNDNLFSRDWELLASFLGAQDMRTPQSYLESTERWERTLPDLMQKNFR